MSSYAVVLQKGNLVVKASNFGDVVNIKFTKDGKVDEFVYAGKAYYALYQYSSTVFIDYVEKERFSILKKNEIEKEKDKYDGVDISLWRDLIFNQYNALDKAVVNDDIFGVLRDDTGLCFYYYTWKYTDDYKEPIGAVNAFYPPRKADYSCDDFGGNVTATTYYNSLKDQEFYDLETGTSKKDIRLVAEVANLISKVDKQMLDAFDKFTTIVGEHGEFKIIDNPTNTYKRSVLLGYRDGLKKWLQLYEKYKNELKKLDDPAQLYIICDLLYRYNMLGTLTVDQKISILLTFCTKPLMDWYFVNFKDGFQQRETLVVRVIDSVRNDQAEEFLEKLGSKTLIVPKPNYYALINPFSSVAKMVEMPLYSVLFNRIDDYFGEDNFTIFANKLNRLVLAKNGIIQSENGLIINTPQNLKSLVKYSYIYNKRYNTDFVGENEYNVLDVNNTTFTLEEVVCTAVSSYYPGGKVKSGTPIVNGVRYESNTTVLNHFDLVSVSYLTNPSFLDLCQTGDCKNLHFLASASYLTYLEEKRDTKFKVDLLSKSLQVLSLAFGIGELLVAVRTANVVRGLIGAYVVIGDVYALTISSPSFIEYLQEAYPNDWQNIQETLGMVSIIHGLTAGGLSLGYSAYSVNNATKFIAEVEVLEWNPAAIERLTVSEVNALQKTRERLLAELYVLRRNSATNEIIENEIRTYRDARNLQIPNAIRGTKQEWNSARLKIIEHRELVNTPNSRNFGFLEGELNGVNSADLIDPVTGYKLWRSVSEQIANEENKVFIASVVGNHSRITDSEFRMINRLALTLKPSANLNDIYTDVSGELKIISENIYCTSCQDVIKQFNIMFPKVNITLIDGTRVGY